MQFDIHSFLNTFIVNFVIFFSGGTIGLFTGMSLLSLVEAMFWMSNLVLQTVTPLQYGRRRRKQG
jgi:hypothetical protein